MQTTKLSNLALIAVLGLLGMGILLDGTLYNKAPPEVTIHSIDNAHSIEVQINNQSVLELQKKDQVWYQTQPISAPAQLPRVQMLLDTNKYSQRSYLLEELPYQEIFKDALTLRINSTEFLLGTIEPVSKLRYVRSGERVYLQPDTIVPMLASVDTVFLDFKITDHVDHITIGDTAFEQPAAWSNLKGLALINKDDYSLNNSVAIEVEENNQTRLMTVAHSKQGYTITTDENFTYLLADKTARSLGLTDLLPGS